MKIDPALKQDLKTYIRERLQNKGGKAYVTISAPYTLGEAELATLKRKVPMLADAHISLEVDKALMAGIIIRYGSRMIDLSLRTELHKLEQTLYETA